MKAGGVADDEPVRHALKQAVLAEVHDSAGNHLPDRADRVGEVLLGDAHDQHPVLPHGEVEQMARDPLANVEEHVLDQDALPDEQVVDDLLTDRDGDRGVRGHERAKWDPLESTCRHASLSIL